MRTYPWLGWGALLAVLGVAGCEAESEFSTDTNAVTIPDAPCMDEDGDGYGFGCGQRDCNDMDPEVHDTCGACDLPSPGCPCEPGSPPVSCVDNPHIDGEGNVLCDEGTRFCRDGVYTECLGLASVAVQVRTMVPSPQLPSSTSSV